MLKRLMPALSLVLCLLHYSFPACASEIRIFAASSLTDAVDEICSRYGAQYPGVTLIRNLAASGTLARQIASGAPADLFASANPGWMTYLVEQGRIPSDRVRILASNALVVVGRNGKQVESMADLTKLSRIAIGSPKSVPVGTYAEQALEASGIYGQLRLENRLVLAKDARQALIYAERGEVDAAFVYRSDAMLAGEAVILFEVPHQLYPPVVYPVALTAKGVENPEAEEFMAYLKSPEATAVLKKYGFVVATGAAAP